MVRVIEDVESDPARLGEFGLNQLKTDYNNLCKRATVLEKILHKPYEF